MTSREAKRPAGLADLRVLAEQAFVMLRGYWYEACEDGGYVCLDREQAWSVLSSGEALLALVEVAQAAQALADAEDAHDAARADDKRDLARAVDAASFALREKLAGLGRIP